MSNKAFVHVGLAKTGTTSIQQQLAGVRDELPRQGFYYPGTGLITNLTGHNNMTGHHCLAWNLNETNSNDFCAKFKLEDFAQEVRTAKDYNLIVSSEELSSLSFSYPKIQTLLGLFPEHEIYVVAYVREQAEFFNSFYLELLRDFNSPGTIDEFIEKRLAELRYDYSYWFNIWSDLLGKNVIIRPYDRKALNGADVSEDFWNVVGLHGLILPEEKRRRNVSLNNLQAAVMIELIRRTTELLHGRPLPRPTKRLLKKIIAPILSLRVVAEGERFWGIRPELLASIREKYAMPNAQFFSKHGMPGFVYEAVSDTPSLNLYAFEDLDSSIRSKVDAMWNARVPTILARI